MKDEEIKKQIESIFGIKIDNNKNKIIEDIEDEVKEILNLGDEE